MTVMNWVESTRKNTGVYGRGGSVDVTGKQVHPGFRCINVLRAGVFARRLDRNINRNGHGLYDRMSTNSFLFFP